MARPHNLFILLPVSLAVYSLTAALTLAGLAVVWLLIPAAALLCRMGKGRATRLWVWVYGRMWLALVSPFVAFRKAGLNAGKFARPSILVVNHLSFFDTFFMGGLPASAFDVTFAVRSWPFRMPWFSPVMRLAGYIDVESDPYESVLLKARAALNGGGHVLFFPEGHRSRNGKLGKFRTGAFRMAVETGAPVVPLVITGSGRLLPPGASLINPAEVGLVALDPIDSGKFKGELAHRRLLAETRAAMAVALGEEVRSDGN